VVGSISCHGNGGLTCENLCKLGLQRVKHEDGGALYDLVRVYDGIDVDLLPWEDLR
jgi:hypothetical protein